MYTDVSMHLRHTFCLPWLAIALLSLAGCNETARLPVEAGFGPSPQLPEPTYALVPTVLIAPAIGWPADGAPIAASGTKVAAFARGLDHPRWLYVLPNGDVLVAETNAPERPDDRKGVKGAIMEHEMKRTGGATPSANRITLLRDADGDGIAEKRSVLLAGLNSPFGMALIGHYLYIANTDAVLRFPYADGDTVITAVGTVVTKLPAGTINHHWTKNLIASRDGSRLYVAVGSNSNAGENGFEPEAERAAIWEIDPVTGSHRMVASGLRNPVGLAWVPETGRLWTAVNERDEMGDNLVPDYMTAVIDGAFYGWPYSYFGQHIDKRPEPPRPDLVAKAIAPDYALGCHTASLGLCWSDGTSLPSPFRSGMFIGQHGSWNRKPRSGYQVIFVPFTAGTPANGPIPLLTGFVNDKGEAMGRPVGVAVDKRGAVLVADDVGNVIWRVTATSVAGK
jgi:glucose/arabinose dehydrogenase